MALLHRLLDLRTLPGMVIITVMEWNGDTSLIRTVSFCPLAVLIREAPLNGQRTPSSIHVTCITSPKLGPVTPALLQYM